MALLFSSNACVTADKKGPVEPKPNRASIATQEPYAGRATHGKVAQAIVTSL